MSSILAVKRAVSIESGVTVGDLESKSRFRHVAVARFVAMYGCRVWLSPVPSYPAIGKEFGNRDHTTVMSACQRVRRYLFTADQSVVSMYDGAARRLGAQQAPPDDARLVPREGNDMDEESIHGGVRAGVEAAVASLVADGHLPCERERYFAAALTGLTSRREGLPTSVLVASALDYANAACEALAKNPSRNYEAAVLHWARRYGVDEPGKVSEFVRANPGAAVNLIEVLVAGALGSTIVVPAGGG